MTAVWSVQRLQGCPGYRLPRSEHPTSTGLQLPGDQRLRLFDIAGNSLDCILGDVAGLVLGCVAGVAFSQSEERISSVLDARYCTWRLFCSLWQLGPLGASGIELFWKHAEKISFLVRRVTIFHSSREGFLEALTALPAIGASQSALSAQLPAGSGDANPEELVCVNPVSCRGSSPREFFSTLRD